MNIKELSVKLKDLLKKLLIYENYILYTKLSEDEIFERIRSISDTDYFNRVVKNQFQMYRKIGYKNAALPFLQGTLFAEKEITFISVKVRLHIVTKLSIGLFVLIPFISLIVSLFDLANLNENNNKITPLLLIVPGGVYFGALIGFKSEAKIIKEFIIQLLNAKS
ncbi:hypothetical protein [Leptospira haakeii]|uniref:Uncharacterized protein n=1 Tax=Leptospira haakeii TaxID=2023198 RepID=A0ABX4PQR1_9LEPT|nr:hypothetical protein [Leptospira haakeii]PKA16414.1 hypothetical protein CH363_09875 [Leptospira haakeii]PKA18097.1 hypothetical protein CH377_19390 [Leptospira haakeii]